MVFQSSLGNMSWRGFGLGVGRGKIKIDFSPPSVASKTTSPTHITLVFTSSGTLSLNGAGQRTAEIFLVQGGTPGGTSNGPAGGGPGGMGLSTPISIGAGTYTVTVGASSSHSQLGPWSSSTGSSGGAGGANPLQPQYGTRGANGGAGYSNSLRTGSSETYSGGGGAVTYPYSPEPFGAGTGGAGGGGPGGYRTFGSPGTFYGAGGGAGTGVYGTPLNVPIKQQTLVPFAGGSGYQGIVIFRAPTSDFS